MSFICFLLDNNVGSSNKEDGLSLGCCLLDNDGNGGIGMDDGLSLSCFSLEFSLGCYSLDSGGSVDDPLFLSFCMLNNYGNEGKVSTYNQLFCGFCLLAGNAGDGGGVDLFFLGLCLLNNDGIGADDWISLCSHDIGCGGCVSVCGA